MFSPNPDEIIKKNFKIFGRKKPRSSRPDERSPAREAGTERKQEPVLGSPTFPRPDEGGNNNEVHFEEILVRKATSESLASARRSADESHALSHGSSGGSVYVLVEQPEKSERVNEKKENDGSPAESDDDEGGKKRTASRRGDNEELVSSREMKLAKRKLVDTDRRRNAWIPCTCPQYKVSRELATKWDMQGIFFGKILVVKIIQLLLINLATFASVFDSEFSLPFLQKGHDWVYLAYVMFASLLVCVRWGLGYRSRWQLYISILMMIPLTITIAFICACVTTIYNSILIPLVTATIFLTFLLLCFAPYLLRKSVMHRTTNLAGCGLALLSSVILLFLKEFETKPMTYWDFVSHVWLPGMVLSQIIVQTTILEIQRIIFGLCFNVSTKRWHIAALYI